jgi:hypothetical protein
MNGMMSKWPVLLTHSVAQEDLDDEGAVRDDIVESWIATACSAYLDRCVVLHEFLERSGVQLCRHTELPTKRLLGRPTSVITTAGVTEVHPRAFTIAVRLRPVGGDQETPLNHTCGVRLEDPSAGEVLLLTDDIRDELIALAHAAEHFN